MNKSILQAIGVGLVNELHFVANDASRSDKVTNDKKISQGIQDDLATKKKARQMNQVKPIAVKE